MTLGTVISTRPGVKEKPLSRGVGSTTPDLRRLREPVALLEMLEVDLCMISV